MARPWTSTEDYRLLQGAGSNGWAWLRRKSGPSYLYPNAPRYRSKAAVANRLYRLGVQGVTQGVFPLNRLAKDTGYHPAQLERARDALNQKWKRLGSGPYLITADQREALIDWLGQDYWVKSLRLYACVRCGTSKRDHRSMGLCSRCYFKVRRRCLAMGLAYGIEALRATVGAVQASGVWLEALDEVSKRLDRGVCPPLSGLTLLAEASTQCSTA